MRSGRKQSRSMLNLDRFSQPMSWEWEPKGNGPIETDCSEQIMCACGCNREILLEDVESYVKSHIWEDEYIINDPNHLNKYLQENDQLAGASRTKENESSCKVEQNVSK